jgi:hypothetical protein
MNQVSFSIVTLDLGQQVWPEIVAEVDGRPLAELAHEYEVAHNLLPASRYGGLCPLRYRFGKWDDYFHGYRTSGMSDPEKTALLNCNCGVFTCWPLLAKLETDFGADDDTDATVTWKDFEHPYHRDRDYSGLGPFVFDWSEYEDAVEALQERVKREFLAEASE